jgi:WD40 repeat protein/uncharacterized protein YjbI with pentapeptide repeats
MKNQEIIEQDRLNAFKAGLKENQGHFAQCLGRDYKAVPTLFEALEKLYLYAVEKQRINASSFVNYVPPKKEALQDMRSFQEKDGLSAILVSGDSGTGKTTWLKKIVQDSWDNFKPGKPIPVFIHLISVPKNRLEEELLNYIFKEQLIESRLISALKLYGNFVFFLDGFDEVAYQGSLYLSNKFANWGRVKIVTACRPEAIPAQMLTEKKYQRWFYGASGHDGPRKSFKEVRLTPFNEKQVKQYIDCYFTPNNNQKDAARKASDCFKALQRMPSVYHLVKNPFILTRVLLVFPTLIKKQEKKKASDGWHLTRTEVFDTFIADWFHQQALRIQNQRALPKSLCQLSLKEIEGLLHCYAENLAHHCLDNGRLQLYLTAEETLASALFERHHAGQERHISGILKKLDAKEAGKLLMLLRSGCLLMTCNGSHSFLHKSLAEYFASNSLFNGFMARIDGQFFQAAHEKNRHDTQSRANVRVYTLDYLSANNEGAAKIAFSNWKRQHKLSSQLLLIKLARHDSPHFFYSNNTNLFSYHGNVSTIKRFKKLQLVIQSLKNNEGRDKCRPKLLSAILTDLDLSTYDLGFQKAILKDVSLINNLADLAKTKPAFNKALYQVVYLSRSVSYLDIAAANAITILKVAGETFANKDFHGVHIANADLSGAILQNVNFDGADLRGVNFDKAYLHGARFAGAFMSNAYFGVNPVLGKDTRQTSTSSTLFSPVTACCFSPDGKYLAVAQGTGYLYLYNLQTWKCEKTFKNWSFKTATLGENTLRLLFTPDSRFLISVSQPYAQNLGAQEVSMSAGLKTVRAIDAVITLGASEWLFFALKKTREDKANYYTKVRLWDIAKSKSLISWKIDLSYCQVTPQQWMQIVVNTYRAPNLRIACSHNGQYIAVTQGGLLKVFSLRTKKQVLMKKVDDGDIIHDFYWLSDNETIVFERSVDKDHPISLELEWVNINQDKDSCQVKTFYHVNALTVSEFCRQSLFAIYKLEKNNKPAHVVVESSEGRTLWHHLVEAIAALKFQRLSFKYKNKLTNKEICPSLIFIEEKTVQIWDVINNRELYRFYTTFPANKIETSSDGSVLLVRDDHMASAWRLTKEGGYFFGSFHCNKAFFPRDHGVTLSRDGRFLTVISPRSHAKGLSDSLMILDITKTQSRQLRVRQATLVAQLFFDEGNIILVDDSNKEIKFLQKNTGEALRTLKLKGLFAVSHRLDNDYRVAVYDEETSHVSIRLLLADRLLYTIKSTIKIKKMGFSPDARWLVFIDETSCLLYLLNKKMALLQHQEKLDFTESAFQFDPQSKHLAIIYRGKNWSNRLKIFSLFLGRVAFISSGLISYYDKTVTLFSAGKMFFANPHGDSAVVSSFPGRSIAFWDMKKAKTTLTLTHVSNVSGGGRDICTAIASPNGNWLILSDLRMGLHIYMIETEKCCFSISQLQGVVVGIAMSDDGAWVSTVDNQGITSLWQFVENEGEARLQLYWTTGAELVCQNMNITGTIGLAPSTQLALKQLGSNGKPSTLLDASKIQKKIRQSRAIYRVDKPAVDTLIKPGGRGGYKVDPESCVIFVLREKSVSKKTKKRRFFDASTVKNHSVDDGEEHTYMLLEGIDVYQDPATGKSQYFRYMKQLEFKHLGGGKALVLCRAISPIELEKEYDPKMYQVDGRSISKGLSLQLLSGTYNDMTLAEQGLIQYSLFGVDKIGSFFNKVPRYNCMSWCEKQLKAIGVTGLTKRCFLDFIVVVPSWHLPDNQETDSDDSDESISNRY